MLNKLLKTKQKRFRYLSQIVGEKYCTVVAFFSSEYTDSYYA